MTELFGEGSGATFSEDGLYRYRLWRDWDRKREHVLWIMLNPSTAHATKDDHTIRKCVGFTKRWGYGRIEVVNLFAFRATDPRELLAAVDPIGPRNDEEIERAINDRLNDAAPLIVAAWGNHGAVHPRSTEIRERLVRVGAKCLGLTKNGQPRHPLRVPYSTELIELPRAA